MKKQVKTLLEAVCGDGGQLDLRAGVVGLPGQVLLGMVTDGRAELASRILVNIHCLKSMVLLNSTFFKLKIMFLMFSTFGLAVQSYGTFYLKIYFLEESWETLV